jgi:hypothetical protein
MMHRAWIFAGIILVVLLLIQLWRPGKNLGEIETAEDFIQVSGVPDTLARIFMRSCYDCHSNRTNYPWYGSVAPASWFLNKHITEGKAHLNFSSWGILDRAQKVSRLNRICDECTDGSMPLKSHLVIHRSARLTPGEIQAICTWTEQEAMEIMNSKD